MLLSFLFKMDVEEPHPMIMERSVEEALVCASGCGAGEMVRAINRLTGQVRDMILSRFL